MIYLVRHGETDWNLFNRWNGNTDTYLNKTGITQAHALAEHLRHVRFAACYCSPRSRARQFCEILYNGATVFDESLSEIHCGVFEGLEETPEMMESFWQAIQTGDKGTESITAFMGRNFALCDMVVEKHQGEDILIVTHAANTRVIDYYFAGKPRGFDFKKRVIGNGEVKTYGN